MIKPRPILSSEELAELSIAAQRVIPLERPYPFWVKFRTYYVFASMLMVVVLYFSYKEYLLELHFSDAAYRAVLGDQYITKRLMAAGATVIFYGVCYFNKKYFALASFGLALVASLNLLNDALAVYWKIDYDFSWIAIALFGNRCLVILLFALNFWAVRGPSSRS